MLFCLHAVLFTLEIGLFQLLLGEQLVRALENGVSKYPVHEGRFPQVAGVTFGFDPTRPPGDRVDARHVKVDGDYVQPHKVTSFSCLWPTLMMLFQTYVLSDLNSFIEF